MSLKFSKIAPDRSKAQRANQKAVGSGVDEREIDCSYTITTNMRGIASFLAMTTSDWDVTSYFVPRDRNDYFNRGPCL